MFGYLFRIIFTPRGNQIRDLALIGQTRDIGLHNISSWLNIEVNPQLTKILALSSFQFVIEMNSSVADHQVYNREI